MQRWLFIGTLCAFGFQPGWGRSGGRDLLGDLADLKDYQTQRASSSDPNWQNGNGDCRPIPPGGEIELANLKGPGEIGHIWFTIAAQERGYSRLLVLKMYWDGEEAPSVLCPVGDFFAMGHGMDVPFDSLPVRVSSDGRGRNCYWSMPFRKAARITVANEGRDGVGATYWTIDWKKLPRFSSKSAYFHAMYRQEFPTVSGKNYLIADIQGRGHYVGTVLSCRQLTPGWWGEGDDFFFVDGEAEPSLRGTGTEDYYCDGWGFRKQAGPFYGAPWVEGYGAFSRTTVYRWHITDPVTFKKSLRVEIEHKGQSFNPDGSGKSGFEERADDFSSVAFWYQIEPHVPYPALPKGHERLYYDFSSAIEGETLLDKTQVSSGPLTTQDLGGASGGSQLWWQPQQSDQSLTLPLDVKKSTSGALLLVMTHSWDYGIYQLEVDGRPVGQPMDLYSPNVLHEEHLFPGVSLSEGEHLITLKNKGKNDSSKGYLLGMDVLLADGM